MFDQHYSNMCAYAYNFLKSVEESEELVQNLFFNLWEKREKIEILNSQTYLFRAVRNACLNFINHKKIKDKYATDKTNDLHTDNKFHINELESRIRTAIDKLPDRRREIFILSRYENKKYKEIAEKLNISEKTVENQMVSALKTLKEELADYLPLIALFATKLF